LIVVPSVNVPVSTTRVGSIHTIRVGEPVTVSECSENGHGQVTAWAVPFDACDEAARRGVDAAGCSRLARGVPGDDGVE